MKSSLVSLVAQKPIQSIPLATFRASPTFSLEESLTLVFKLSHKGYSRNRIKRGFLGHRGPSIEPSLIGQEIHHPQSFHCHTVPSDYVPLRIDLDYDLCSKNE